MKKQNWVFLILFFLSNPAAPVTTMAADFGFRYGIDFGAWWGEFSQQGNSQLESKTTINPAAGSQLTAGFQIGPFFAEYAPYWYFVQKFSDNPDKSNDATFWSLSSFQVGIDILGVVEIYGGGAWSFLTFTSGAQAGFSGLAPKVGVNVKLWNTSGHTFRLVANYHKHFISKDSAGSLPNSVTTRATVFFVGIGFSAQPD